MEISQEYKDLKLGSNLLEQINHYLDTENKSSKLVNAIGDGKSLRSVKDLPKRKIYENHGWEKIEGNTMTRKPNKLE
jgi:hypothetical protein